jgi:hypothetical protein
VANLVAKGKNKVSAIKICKSSVMGKEGMVLENVPLSFTAPIKEMVSIEEGTKRKAIGTLLVNTTSRNGVTYEIDEINTATYGGYPFNADVQLTASLNHTEDVTDNIAVWKPVPKNGEIGYEATIFNTGKHPYVTDMFDKGLIKYVSVEAIAKNLVESSGKRIAKGLDIVGMGFVKTPGVKEVSLAIAEAFDSYKIDESEVIVEKEETGERMAEEIKVSLDTKEFNESIKSLVEKLKTNEDLVKKIEELEKKVNEKKESKGIVTETVQKVAPRFKMVKENNKRYPGTIDIYAEGNNY